MNKREYKVTDKDGLITNVIAETMDAAEDFVCFYTAGNAGPISMFAVNCVESVTSCEYKKDIDEKLAAKDS